MLLVEAATLELLPLRARLARLHLARALRSRLRRRDPPGLKLGVVTDRQLERIAAVGGPPAKLVAVGMLSHVAGPVERHGPEIGRAQRACWRLSHRHRAALDVGGIGRRGLAAAARAGLLAQPAQIRVIDQSRLAGTDVSTHSLPLSA